jgi:protein TonB
LRSQSTRTGGTIAALTFAKPGQRVAVIERKYVGGSCPNIACLPNKNIIHSAKVASYLRRSRATSTSQSMLSKPMLANLRKELERSRLQRAKEDRN